MRDTKRAVHFVMTILVICATSITVLAADPGADIPNDPTLRRDSQVSDQKKGSILVYNVYTSSASDPGATNTRFSLTNTSDQLPIAVHLFFVEGVSCSVSDRYLCLTGNQTASMLASTSTALMGKQSSGLSPASIWRRI